MSLRLDRHRAQPFVDFRLGANLIQKAAVPVTNLTGGTSVGNPSAGSQGDTEFVGYGSITTADKAGAGIITGLVLIGILSGAYWMVS